MRGAFDTTSWSMIAAVQGEDTVVRREALNRLCATYWPPLYCYVRQKGKNADEAQDLTQAFFCHMLEGGRFALAAHDRGRFRYFLMTSMDHFMADAWRRDAAAKRGGRTAVFPLDFATAEGRYAWDHRPDADPRVVYDRHWAQTVLDTAAARLRDEYTQAGKAALFEALKDRLTEREGPGTYEKVGAALDMTPQAVKMAAYRMRKRYGVCLRQEIASTLADEADTEDELRALFRVASC